MDCVRIGVPTAALLSLSKTQLPVVNYLKVYIETSVDDRSDALTIANRAIERMQGSEMLELTIYQGSLNLPAEAICALLTHLEMYPYVGVDYMLALIRKLPRLASLTLWKLEFDDIQADISVPGPEEFCFVEPLSTSIRRLCLHTHQERQSPDMLVTLSKRLLLGVPTLSDFRMPCVPRRPVMDFVDAYSVWHPHLADIAFKLDDSHDAAEDPDGGGLLSFGTMFGAAASWGRRVQAELQLGQLVGQVKKQSEDVSRAYSQDIAEFAQAVRTGASRGVEELSTRFGQLKADVEKELATTTTTAAAAADDDDNDNNASSDAGPRDGPLAGLRRRLMQIDGETTRRLVGRVGTDLESLLRDAIVIEAPTTTAAAAAAGGVGEEEEQQQQKIVYDRRMARLAQLQEAESTYLDDPSAGAQAGDYAAFAQGFSLAAAGDDVRRLLAQDNVAAMHGRLVPARVAEDAFWTRYFFRAWVVEQEELRRQKLVDDAAAAAAAQEDLGWGSDGESDAAAADAKEDAQDPGAKGDRQGAEDPAIKDDKEGAEGPAIRDDKEEDTEEPGAWEEWE
ncbi:hypothetical protein H4R18_005661 [Coemansia javaensis]|uniref:BSD domain-containing protein n=1 Tax=Coemansia javaensis TaxID=2761396 RepID=A0A9W8H1T8_9FUNG|nr:hypothetical protein H4R18_005661 [Coemansia javaensis]